MEPYVATLGFFRMKAKSIVGLARALVERHGGEVPQSMDALVKLPGVGRKTANVVLGVLWNKPEGVVVDTHVIRLSQRLGWTKAKDADKIEPDLCRDPSARGVGPRRPRPHLPRPPLLLRAKAGVRSLQRQRRLSERLRRRRSRPQSAAPASRRAPREEAEEGRESRETQAPFLIALAGRKTGREGGRGGLGFPDPALPREKAAEAQRTQRLSGSLATRRWSDRPSDGREVNPEISASSAPLRLSLSPDREPPSPPLPVISLAEGRPAARAGRGRRRRVVPSRCTDRRCGCRRPGRPRRCGGPGRGPRLR